MAEQQALDWIRGPGNNRTRRYHQQRTQAATNRIGAARAREILERIREP